MKNTVKEKLIEAEMKNQLLFMEVIGVIKKVIEEYDGKILNKNLEKALWNAVDKEINQEEKKIQYAKVKFYDVSARIEIHAYNDVVEEEGLSYPVELGEISFMFTYKTMCTCSENG